MRFLILLALLPLTAFAQQKTIVCPTGQPGAAYGSCPTQTCAVPTKDTDLVLTKIADKMTYERLSSVPQTGAMFACGVTPVKWTTRAALGLTPATPPVPPVPPTSVEAKDIHALWWSPVQRDTAGALIEVAGYRVYQGTQPGIYGAPKAVTGVRHDLSALAPGKYYFAVSAVDSSGKESAKSGEVAFDMPAPTTPTPKQCAASAVTTGSTATFSCTLQ